MSKQKYVERFFHQTNHRIIQLRKRLSELEEILGTFESQIELQQALWFEAESQRKDGVRGASDRNGSTVTDDIS